METDYSLEEQQEPEQFEVEDADEKPSKEVYKKIKEQKQYEQLRRKQYEMKHNEKQKAKHKAVFHRINNQNYYVCDNCGEKYKEEEGSLMYKREGEFAYCGKCLKELYPNYKRVRLATTVSKTNFLNNHWDTKYFNGLY